MTSPKPSPSSRPASPPVAARSRGAPPPEARERWPADAWDDPLLVIRLSSLGDVLLTSGPLRLLSGRRPQLLIRVLTQDRFAPLLRGLPFVHEVAAVESAIAPLPARTVCDWQGGLRGWRALRRYAPHARSVRYPTAALHRRLRVLGGSRVPAVEPYVVRLARSIAGRPIALSALTPQTELGRAEHPGLAARLERSGHPERGWLVTGPGASRPLKAVPEALISQIEACLQQRGWGVVRLMAPSASQGAGGAAAGVFWREPSPGRLEVRATLPHVAALLRCASLFVGSDSGILHMATAIGVPAIGLFGPTAPSLGFSPLGNATAVGVELACRPCHVHGPRRCWLGHRRCWRELSVDRVLSAVARLRPEPPTS
ncbi:MAG: hypothetical protein GF330_11975 [Candidatus Eisenbacteria bacterium]|nr:hypothetical protein [Candidatus Eisenbacteria bacterium]